MPRNVPSASCGLYDAPATLLTFPNRGRSEKGGHARARHVAVAIGAMVLAPEYRHVPTGTLAVLAQRIGKVSASPSTCHRLVRKYGWRRPRIRVHPAKPKVGLRTTRPDEMWRIDTTVIGVLDGTRAYLHAVIDNFSRRIWRGAWPRRPHPIANSYASRRWPIERDRARPMTVRPAPISHIRPTFVCGSCLADSAARTRTQKTIMSVKRARLHGTATDTPVKISQVDTARAPACMTARGRRNHTGSLAYAPQAMLPAGRTPRAEARRP
jgi:hypothetical protein